MGDPAARVRSRATRRRPAGSTGSGALVAALAVGGLAFGVIRGQANEWNDTAAWIAIAIGVVSLIAFPILMATRPNPLVPLEPVPVARVHVDQPGDVLHLRRACT